MDRHGPWNRGCYSSGVDVSVLETLFACSFVNSRALHALHRSSCLHVRRPRVLRLEPKHCHCRLPSQMSLFASGSSLAAADVSEKLQQCLVRELDAFGPECVEQLLVRIVQLVVWGIAIRFSESLFEDHAHFDAVVLLLRATCAVTMCSCRPLHCRRGSTCCA